MIVNENDVSEGAEVAAVHFSLGLVERLLAWNDPAHKYGATTKVYQV